jgi:hypothetical protein
MGAATDSEILDFRQTLSVGEHRATFECIATIIWKHTLSGWREARWQEFVISSNVPADLLIETDAT